MLRHILPDSADPEIIALDAALRRGDLHWVGRHLQMLPVGRQTPEWLLRAGVHAYLLNDYVSSREYIERLGDAGDELHRHARFLSALIAIDLKRPEIVLPLLNELSSAWRGDERRQRTLLLAESTLAAYTSRFDEGWRLLNRLAAGEEENAPWLSYEAKRIGGVLAFQQTDYERARSLLEAARSGFEMIGDRYEVARCDNTLADTFRRLDDHPNALHHAERAIAYFQEQNASVPLARCHNVLGSIQHYFNNYDEALQSYHFALGQFKEAGLIIDHVWALHNIGMIYRQTGQFKRALQTYVEAKALIPEASYPDVNAYLDRSLAELVWHMGEEEKALSLLQSAGETFLQTGAPVHAANAWRLMAEYHFELGDLDEARALLGKSSALFLQAHRPAQAALTAIILARVALAQGEQSYAIQLLETSADLLTERHMPYRAAEALTELAEIHFHHNRFDESRAALQLAMRLGPQDFHEFAWRIQALLAQLALKDQDIPAARTHLKNATDRLWNLRRAAVSPGAAAALARKAQSIYLLTIDMALSQNDVEAALCALEEYKAIQLFHRLEPGLDADLRPPDSSKSVAQTVRRLNRLRQAIQTARQEQNWDRLALLEKEFDYLAQELDALQTPYVHLVKKPWLDVAELRAELDARHGFGNWGCLVTGHFEMEGKENQLYHFWLDSRDILVSTRSLDPISQQLLDLACHPEPSYRQKILDWENERSVPGLWTKLEDIMLPPGFRSAIEKVQTVYLSSSGQLSVFPFFALRLNGIPIALQKDITEIASLPILHTLLQQNASAASQILAPASVKGLVCAISQHQQRGLIDLPYTAQEATAIFKNLSRQSVLLLEAQATLNAVQQILHAQTDVPFGLLHFSTHARFNPYHTMLSHLSLYEDEAYVSDILHWRLDAELVTLAACDTAIGHYWPGDEQMGLPHAFLIAGARRVLATLWPVSDEASAHFLDAFYQNLNESASVAAALRQTQIAHRHQNPSPFHWGFFTLIGLA